MPDVGTLYLTIESNASTAAKGLEELSGALGTIQTKLGTGLDLSKIVTPLN